MKAINNNYEAAIELAKPAGHVFDCITHVTKWWSKDFEGSSTQLDDEFIIHHPGAHYSKQKLVNVIPGKKMEWLVTESMLYWLQHKQEWTNTKMIFRMADNGAKTRLHFTHEGLVPEKECYEVCSKSWDKVINEWLFTYITTGRTAFTQR